MTNFLFYIIFLLFGLTIGSFLNVVILRLPEEESILGRSHCPKCKKQIAAYDLIPVLSYIFLWGHCRNCKEKISLQYPLIELATAALFALFYFWFGLNYLLLLYLPMAAVLIVIFVYDLKFLEVPEIFAWIFLILALVIGLWQSDYNIANVLLGGLIGGGVLGILVGISEERLMGAGDIKIGLAFGFLLGYPKSLMFLFSAFVIGAIVGLVLILFNGKKLKSEIAFAPFLIIAGIICIIWGNTLINLYLKFAMM